MPRSNLSPPFNRHSGPYRSSGRTLLCALLAVQLAAAPALSAQSAPPPQSTGSASAPQTSTSGDSTNPGENLPVVPATIAPGASSVLTPEERLLHVLNRFTYGPRPGDLERLRAEGLNKWFSAQMNPQTIDDSALDRRLADYPAMQLSIDQLMAQYPNQQMIRAAMNGRASRPGGEAEKAIYKAQEERLKDRANKKTADGNARADDPDPLPDDPQTILALDPKARFSELCHLTPAQLNLLRKQLPDDQRPRLTQGFTPRQIEELAAVSNPQGVVASELVQTKLLRDIYTERQLNEVMTDFWLNHFNVYLRKSQEAPYFITAFERDTIRPRALGHFENLLVATAVSPAMLNYLDNASSIGPHSPSVSFETYRRFPRLPPKNSVGLNENYAREIMELHTLGVNGGYTQHDVTEVAKVFTGWTIDRPFGSEGGPSTHVYFDPSKHEPGNKIVLGVTIKDGGPKEGMQVLHLLATSPQTARFVSTKLAVRFVADDPPTAVIDRMTAAWLKSNGDIRQVLLAMVNSPEFFTRSAYRAKVKTPQDFVVSAVRASGSEVVSAASLAAVVSELGMPLYGMQTPNGYSMRADPWNNTAALISRMNFAVALSSNRVAGVQTDLPGLIGSQPSAAALQAAAISGQLTPRPDPLQIDTALEARLLHMPASDRTRQTILAQISTSPQEQQSSLRQIAARNAGRDPLTSLRAPVAQNGSAPDPQLALAAGLLFGSPEFQRR